MFKNDSVKLIKYYNLINHNLIFNNKAINRYRKENFEISEDNSCKLIFPEDVLVGKNMKDKSKVKELSDITDDDLILDIGPKTIKKIKDIIKTSKTILWNGPAGYFEIQILLMEVMKLQKQLLKKIEMVQSTQL